MSLAWAGSPATAATASAQASGSFGGRRRPALPTTSGSEVALAATTRHAAGHGFERVEAEALVAGGKYEDVRRPIQVGLVPLLHRTEDAQPGFGTRIKVGKPVHVDPASRTGRSPRDYQGQPAGPPDLRPGRQNDAEVLPQIARAEKQTKPVRQTQPTTGVCPRRRVAGEEAFVDAERHYVHPIRWHTGEPREIVPGPLRVGYQGSRPPQARSNQPEVEGLASPGAIGRQRQGDQVVDRHYRPRGAQGRSEVGHVP